MKKYSLLFWLAAVSIPLYKLWLGVEVPDIAAIAPPDLAQPPPVEKTDALTQILNHNLWDKQRGQIIELKREQQKKGKENAPQQNASWQLTGIVLPNGAYIKTDDKIKRYKTRDQLPDGAIISSILSDGIVLEKNAKKYNVYLFGKKP